MPNQIDKIIISSDHAGFTMKEYIKSELVKMGMDVTDVGAHSTDAVDYPLFAARVASAVAKGEYARGITVCGSGIGASITANRFKGVRAALCLTEEMARLSRQHNNANVLVIAGRLTPQETVSKILTAWFEQEFEGGRHERRVKLIDEIAEKEEA